MDEKYEKSMLEVLTNMVDRCDFAALAGQACFELMRIANAQEKIVEIMEQDVEALIAAEVESRAETVAAEMESDKSKRSFIGKK